MNDLQIIDHMIKQDDINKTILSLIENLQKQIDIIQEETKLLIKEKV